jgi:CheY-like chemotaxis protein
MQPKQPELAHELNNILAVMRLNLALARRELGPAHAAVESLAEIEGACVRIETLVSGLRAVAGGPASALPAPLPGAQAHILFLDDDEALVFLAQRLLRRLGHRVSTFTRMQDALSALRADPQGFQLVISDVNLLGDSGFDLARELSALRKDLPLVLVSGHVTDALRARAREAGVAELLHKPHSVEEFAQMVHERLRDPR